MSGTPDKKGSEPLDSLSILSQTAVAHVEFGWFNLAWPNIGFWIAVIVVFILFAWTRIPMVMESDAESRKEAEK